MAKADTVDTLCQQIAMAELPPPTREYHFAPVDEVTGRALRRWRADLAWPADRLLLEVDGSVFVGGRHGGARSAHRDLEKRNAQTLLGWRTLHVTPTDVTRGMAIVLVQVAFGRRDVGEIL